MEYRKSIIRVVIGLIALQGLGCSLIGANRQVGIQKSAAPEVRDVPFEARENKEAPLRKRLSFTVHRWWPNTIRSRKSCRAKRF